jgi:hypothetical protein
MLKKLKLFGEDLKAFVLFAQAKFSEAIFDKKN